MTKYELQCTMHTLLINYKPKNSGFLWLYTGIKKLLQALRNEKNVFCSDQLQVMKCNPRAADGEGVCVCLFVFLKPNCSRGPVLMEGLFVCVYIVFLLFFLLI